MVLDEVDQLAGELFAEVWGWDPNMELKEQEVKGEHERKDSGWKAPVLRKGEQTGSHKSQALCWQGV